MYSIKEKFINECTIQGYIKNNKSKSKGYKFWIRLYVLVIIIQIVMIINYKFLRSFGIYFIYINAALFIPAYLFAINSVLANLEVEEFNKYRFNNDKVKAYFQNQKELFIDNLFKNKDKSIKFDKLEFYVAWCEEMEGSNKFDGLFEKAIIAGLTLPIWSKFVEMYFEEIKLYTSNEFIKYFLFLFMIAALIFASSLFLKNTVALMYLEYFNSESEEFKSFRRTLNDYYGKHKFN